MGSEFVGVFTIGQTIDRGVRLYRRGLSNVFLLMLIPGLLGSIPQMLQMMSGGMLASDPAHPFASYPGGVAGFLVLILVSTLLGGYVMVVMNRYFQNLATSNTPLTGAGLLGLATPKDLLYVATLILWYLVGIIAVILLVIPGVYLLNVAALLAIPVAVIERRYGLSGIGRVLKLTKGRWWKTFVINLVTMLIVVGPIAVTFGFFMWTIISASGGLAALADSAAAPAATREFSPLSILGAVVYLLTVSLIGPLYAAVGIVHYNSLRSEKEHSDLDGQFDALAAKK